jgi:hypothetical protein
MRVHAFALFGIAALALVSGPASGQTLEERAAKVRELLDSPPPVETVIDRGTRTIGRAAPGATGGAGTPSVDSRLTSEGVPLSPEFAERMNRILNGGMPGVEMNYGNSHGTAFVNDPRGTARTGPVQGPGPTWFQDYAPGVLVIRRDSADRVGGTANLRTGDPTRASDSP